METDLGRNITAAENNINKSIQREVEQLNIENPIDLQSAENQNIEDDPSSKNILSQHIKNKILDSDLSKEYNNFIDENPEYFVTARNNGVQSRNNQKTNFVINNQFDSENISKSFNSKPFGRFFTEISIKKKTHIQKPSISKYQHTARNLLQEKKVKSFNQENLIFSDVKIDQHTENLNDENLLNFDVDQY